MKVKNDSKKYYSWDMANNPDYDPVALLTAVSKKLGAKNDARLAVLLELGPPAISKIRNKSGAVSPFILLRMAEATGWTISVLRTILRA